MTLVERLSRYASGLTFEALPPEVVHQAKRLIVDTIGCALGGYWSEPARIARELAATVRSSEPVTLIGSGEHTSLDLATFANGVMIRFLDYNDGYTSTGESGHPSDSIAAVLTTSELRRRSGRDAIVATVLAYEVFCRVCDEVDLKPLGFDHVTVGGMASTAAAARLLGLSEPEIAQAFNLGIAPNVALYQTRIGHVSMWKGCAYANASRNAVFAAMLASRGMTGPSPVFEGVGGYFKAVTRQPFELRTLGGEAGHSFKIMECSVKRFPLGQYSQTVVEAALQLRSKVGGPEEIAAVEIETVTTAIRLMAGDPDKWEPKTRESADHSMPYTVAVALMHGEVEQKHFGERYLNDPKLRALTRRVKATATEEADRRMPEAMLCRMTLVTTGGERHEAVVEYHKGHWKNPMSDGELENKFRKLAREVLDEAQTTRLLAALWRLEEMPDAGEVVRLTQAGLRSDG
ncbi:MAG TPA: MmgE/PrpD family protein [Burkholderiales bacterium]|nr:MmgE/PrpD family protein [Burkholderiales bacterium]